MAHDLVTELLQYSSLACFMSIWQLCANLLIPNCLRSNLSYSPLAALELYVNGVKSMFYKGKYRFFRKSVVLISVGITYLPIYYIMCIELKEISAWCFAGFKSGKAPGRNLILRLKLLQLFFCQSSCLHDLRPRNTHCQQVAGYFQTFR